MTDRGDLLDLLDRAPAGLRTFQGSLRTWRHDQRRRRATEILAGSNRATVSYITTEREDVDLVDEGYERRDHVWVDLPNRWRIEGAQLDLSDGTIRWIGSPGRVTARHDQVPDLGDTTIGHLFHPGPSVLGVMVIGAVSEDEAGGRPCWRAETTTRTGQREAMRYTFRWGGLDHTLWVDRQTGIVLRHHGRVDDEPCMVQEWVELAMDAPVDPSVFGVDPTTTEVERYVDRLVRMAEARGVDLSGVDRNDERAVQLALGDVVTGKPTARLRAARRAMHVPIGPPPVDEAAARRQIEHAFRHHDETAADGTTLVNVQSGEGLAGPLALARRRIPAAEGASAIIVVDDVVFLRSDEAVVWFGIDVDDQRSELVNNREGRAVQVDGVWKVEHATLVGLLAFAGVSVPPPPVEVEPGHGDG